MEAASKIHAATATKSIANIAGPSGRGMSAVPVLQQKPKEQQEEKPQMLAAPTVAPITRFVADASAAQLQAKEGEDRPQMMALGQQEVQKRFGAPGLPTKKQTTLAVSQFKYEEQKPPVEGFEGGRFAHGGARNSIVQRVVVPKPDNMYLKPGQAGNCQAFRGTRAAATGSQYGSAQGGHVTVICSAHGQDQIDVRNIHFKYLNPVRYIHWNDNGGNFVWDQAFISETAFREVETVANNLAVNIEVPHPISLTRINQNIAAHLQTANNAVTQAQAAVAAATLAHTQAQGYGATAAAQHPIPTELATHTAAVALLTPQIQNALQASQQATASLQLAAAACALVNAESVRVAGFIAAPSVGAARAGELATAQAALVTAQQQAAAAQAAAVAAALHRATAVAASVAAANHLQTATTAAAVVADDWEDL